MSRPSLAIRVDDEIELRLNELRYVEAYHELILRNLDHLRAWMPWAAFEQTAESTRTYMRDVMRQFADGVGLPTALWYQGQLAGSIGFPRMSWEKQVAEIGYWLDKELEGRGIITRACRMLVTYAFEEYGLNKVEIHAAADNRRSRAVAERLEFAQEGVIRQIEWLSGVPHDLIVYGKLSSEWRTSEPGK